jgi:hypothetical protein
MPIRKRALAAVLGLVAVLFTIAATAGPAGADPYTGGTTVSVSNANPTGCQKITLTGSGFGANELVDVVLHSTPQLLATVRANPAGHITVRFGFPSGVTGSHTVVATGRTTGDHASANITIRACSGTNGGSAGSPAGTGVAVVAISTVGVALLVAGCLFLLSARRRRRVLA